jgi:hypothetical protein
MQPRHLVSAAGAGLARSSQALQKHLLGTSRTLTLLLLLVLLLVRVQQGTHVCRGSAAGASSSPPPRWLHMQAAWLLLLLLTRWGP